ncbi:MAG: hypothetical protein RLY20_340 [Verrucomicrobiota bacterium]|jgi:ComEC/Rec2-related protein
MRHPLVKVALLYTTGLLLAEWFPLSLPALLGMGFLLCIGAFVWERARPWLLIPLIIAVGYANLISRTAVSSPKDLRLSLTNGPVDGALRGRLVTAPSVRTHWRGTEPTFRTLAVMEVTAMRNKTDWLPASGQVMTTTPADLSGQVFNGTEVEVAGIIAPPPDPVAPGLFDYHAYLRRQGIYFQLKADGTSSWHVLGEAKPTMSDRFIAWSQRVLEHGLPEKDEPLRLLEAMTLGLQTGLNNDVYAPFTQSGTMHIFAISGLHIALIAALLVAVLRGARMPRNGCGWVVIPLIWFYTGATGWQPSAIRSTIMMTIIIGGWSLGRPSDLLNSLAAAGLVILVWQPQQLFQASFQLSFFVVLSIALLMPPLEKLLNKWLAHDPLLPRDALPRWRRWLEVPLRWLAMSLATSLAAWLGSLPLTAYYFHIFSPVTLLANLLIVPLSSAALACNLGALLCGTWLPWAGELFNNAAWLWMRWMVGLSEWSAALPGAFSYVPSPPAWGFIAYYLLLIGCLSGWFFRKENFRWTFTALATVLTVFGWAWHTARNETTLTVIPLSGGHAVFADEPGRANDWLIDCGNSNAVTFVTLPFLHAQGVNTLTHLALTHGDLQHIGGGAMFIRAFPTRQIVLSPIRFRSATYRSITELLEQLPERQRVTQRGDILGHWQILHPEESDRFPQADDASLVMLGEFYGSRVLLLGDLGRPGQEELMLNVTNLQADIVITGLPEQTEALCNGLLERVKPKLIIVADSEFPATKRAPPALKNRLAKQSARVLYTRTTDAITLRFTPDGWSTRLMREPGTNAVDSALSFADEADDP